MNTSNTEPVELDYITIEIPVIKPFTQEALEKYKVLVNEEITQQTREDFFMGV